jgi:hypothetical protein
MGGLLAKMQAQKEGLMKKGEGDWTLTSSLMESVSSASLAPRARTQSMESVESFELARFSEGDC